MKTLRILQPFLISMGSLLLISGCQAQTTNTSQSQSTPSQTMQPTSTSSSNESKNPSDTVGEPAESSGTMNKEQSKELFDGDITNDGVQEHFVLDESLYESEGTVTLSVVNDEGRIIWKEEFNTAHAGWNSIYYGTMEGQNFFVRYQPSMYYGEANFYYKVFSLDEQGNELMIYSDNISFTVEDAMNNSYLPTFVEELNRYLSNCILLVSTEEGELVYSTKDAPVKRVEELSFLN